MIFLVKFILAIEARETMHVPLKSYRPRGSLNIRCLLSCPVHTGYRVLGVRKGVPYTQTF